MSDPWPFDQPENCATFTTRHVMREGRPILDVYHDEEDHGWQFHSNDEFSTEAAMIVALKEVVKLDATVLEVADLPPGWEAHRSEIGGSWQKIQSAPEPE